MSAPPATAAPSPAAPPSARLLDLPAELLVRALSHCGPADIARVAAVSLLFHASLALEGIRLRLKEAGFELPAQPEGEACAVRWLCFAALLRESNPPARAAAGLYHSLFIDGEGRLSSCGYAASFHPSLLGHGEGVRRLNTPTRLPSTLGERAVSVAAGADHSLALTADGAAWSWGAGDYGQLGHGDTQRQPLPKKVEDLAGRRVVAVSAGGHYSLALADDGSVWSWGRGAYGQLGHGDQQIQLQPKTIEAFAGLRVVAVSAGGYHSLAVTADGAVWSWGRGDLGRLGHGDKQERPLPKKIEDLADRRVVAVSAGEHHSLALAADGSVWSWGYGAFGRLGHGDQQSQLLPKQVGHWLAGASSRCRLLEATTASPSPPTAVSGAGAAEALAAWATATRRTSSSPSRSRPAMMDQLCRKTRSATVSSLRRREATTASPSPLTAPSSPGAGASRAA